MPTNEERREVAAKLRGLYPDDVLPPFAQVRKDIYEAIGCGWGQKHQGQTLHKRLADLIEPEPERTCEVVEKQTEWQFNFGVKDYEFSCGHMVGWAHTYEPKYCPKCGAKVVS